MRATPTPDTNTPVVASEELTTKLMHNSIDPSTGNWSDVATHQYPGQSDARLRLPGAIERSHDDSQGKAGSGDASAGRLRPDRDRPGSRVTDLEPRHSRDRRIRPAVRRHRV